MANLSRIRRLAKDKRRRRLGGVTIEAFARRNCSIARPMAFLGERWAVLVLRDLTLGRRRFDEIQESLGVASNVLSQRLATLVEEGIVERHRYSRHPERFEYRLTQKGIDLVPVLMALMRWGDRYTAGPAGPPMETVHEDCGRAFQMVPTCSECGEEIDPRHVHSRPGPGADDEQLRRWHER
jgi:DNA-binding HxlR family transcriptional regulator